MFPTKIASYSLGVLMSLAALSWGGSSIAEANTGGIGAVLEWCDSTVSNLQSAKIYANNAQFNGNHTGALLILRSELSRASQQGWGSIRPFTTMAAKRVLDIASIIERSIPAGNLNTRTVVYFLMNGVDFVIEAATQLDIPYHVPYMGQKQWGCGECRTVDPLAYERSMVEFVSKQMNLVLSGLTTYQGGVIYPVGHENAFLKSLQVITAASAVDLEQSLLRANYACEMQALIGLSSRLSGFMRGDRTYFPNAFNAVQSAYYEANMIAERVGAARRCGGYY